MFNVLCSSFISTGNGTAVSTTPILFSTHSVNQILSPDIVKSNICAMPQLSRTSTPLSQSPQLGFFDGIWYSTRDWCFGSITEILFAVCSLNTSRPDYHFQSNMV